MASFVLVDSIFLSTAGFCGDGAWPNKPNKTLDMELPMFSDIGAVHAWSYKSLKWSYKKRKDSKQVL